MPNGGPGKVMRVVVWSARRMAASNPRHEARTRPCAPPPRNGPRLCLDEHDDRVGVECDDGRHGASWGCPAGPAYAATDQVRAAPPLAGAHSLPQRHDGGSWRPAPLPAHRARSLEASRVSVGDPSAARSLRVLLRFVRVPSWHAASMGQRLVGEGWSLVVPDGITCSRWPRTSSGPRPRSYRSWWWSWSSVSRPADRHVTRVVWTPAARPFFTAGEVVADDSGALLWRPQGDSNP